MVLWHCPKDEKLEDYYEKIIKLNTDFIEAHEILKNPLFKIQPSAFDA